MPIGEESELANADEAPGQDVKHEAPNELLRVERHGALAVTVAVVAPAEGDFALGDIKTSCTSQRRRGIMTSR